MAWNKPTNNTDNMSTVRKRPTLGLVMGAAAILMVVAACALWFAVWRRNAPASSVVRSVKAPTLIRDVMLAPAGANAATAAVVSPNEETYRDERGILRRKIGNGRVFDPSVRTIKINPNVDKDGNPRYHSKFMIFHDGINNEIARLISMPRGATVFGSRNYGKKFEELFMKSLKEPIVSDPNDTPYERKLKENVSFVKDEIAERMKKGEKLSDIFGKAEKELRRLDSYRKSLQTQLSQIASNDKLSADDMRDAVRAANMMLRDKGCSPVSESAFVNAHLKMQTQDPTSTENK